MEKRISEVSRFKIILNYLFAKKISIYILIVRLIIERGEQSAGVCR